MNQPIVNPASFSTYFGIVYSNGVSVPSRHGPTIESQRPLTCSFQAGMLVKRRRILYSLGWMEMLQFLGGTFDLDLIKQVAPRANHELFTAQMAYGPRVAHQMPAVVKKLWSDPHTRQAIVFVGGHEDGPTDSQPCTSTIQFLLRDGTLRTIVSMRSWDLVKGMAYDAMMFGGMALAVAQCVRARAGEVFVTAGSPHIYLDETELVPAYSDTVFDLDPEMGNEWEDIAAWARDQATRHDRWIDHTPAGVLLRSIA